MKKSSKRHLFFMFIALFCGFHSLKSAQLKASEVSKCPIKKSADDVRKARDKALDDFLATGDDAYLDEMEALLAQVTESVALGQKLNEELQNEKVSEERVKDLIAKGADLNKKDDVVGLVPLNMVINFQILNTESFKELRILRYYGLHYLALLLQQSGIKPFQSDDYAVPFVNFLEVVKDAKKNNFKINKEMLKKVLMLFIIRAIADPDINNKLEKIIGQKDDFLEYYANEYKFFGEVYQQFLKAPLDALADALPCFSMDVIKIVLDYVGKSGFLRG